MSHQFLVDYFTLTAAFRYYLGRQTIAAVSFAQELASRYHEFSEEQRQFFTQEIDEHKARAGSVGDPQIDSPHWEKLADCFRKGNRYRVTTRYAGQTVEHTCFKHKGQYIPLEHYLRQPHQEISLIAEYIQTVTSAC